MNQHSTAAVNILHDPPNVCAHPSLVELCYMLCMCTIPLYAPHIYLQFVFQWDPSDTGVSWLYLGLSQHTS